MTLFGDIRELRLWDQLHPKPRGTSNDRDDRLQRLQLHTPEAGSAGVHNQDLNQDLNASFNALRVAEGGLAREMKTPGGPI